MITIHTTHPCHCMVFMCPLPAVFIVVQLRPGARDVDQRAVGAILCATHMLHATMPEAEKPIGEEEH